MLDINYIVNNVDEVKKNVEARNMECDVDRLVEVYALIKANKQKSDGVRMQMNNNQKQIKECKTPEERAAVIEAGKALKAELAVLKEELEKIEPEYKELLLSVPNMMAPDTPIGKNEDLNVEVYRYKEPKVFDFEPESHVEIAKRLDLIDFDAYLNFEYEIDQTTGMVV